MSNTNDWKQKNNKVSSITTAQLIQNTIDKETAQAFEESIEENSFDYIEEGYYRAVYLLNQLL